ncbi:MAG: 2-amino-4-hydroxy-6-hydroxymethyldihydropteridine pyrophosphokinase [Paracidovorax wautersii]|uniref:2-amino-4-hydroxy-6-hydroxymethyldihydropteridine pyrophosphokinase n=1 Tax=Paracidovorax wautersii TaxID=1177982 RepID=A0A7V8JR89_9BURK|nr:MAG: 2-amino-4-hydroxy-6-hydroxymethyldihydropteridine pyrophosphokinase [Paracidovorax wautersii]
MTLPAARAPVVAYVALGGNLGDARANVLGAFDALALTPGITLRHRSSLYRTAPIDSSGPDYINAVAEIQTTLDAMSLLGVLQAIEQVGGRERPYANAPRTLDLDLLRYGSARIASPRLVVPHPRMQARAFVLVPLAEIAPQTVDTAWLDAVRDQAIERLPAG